MWVLGGRDLLREVGAALEERRQRHGAAQPPTDPPTGGGGGKQAQRPPECLLGKEIGVAGVLPQARGDEALGVGAGETLACVNAGVLGSLEVPLLLVGHRLHHQPACSEHGGQRVNGVQGRQQSATGAVRRGPGNVDGRQNGGEEDVLNERDEDQIEDLECQGAHPGAKDGPAVVLPAVGIAPLAPEVVGKARSPHGDEASDDGQAGMDVGSRRGHLSGQYPRIVNRDDAPDLVNPAAKIKYDFSKSIECREKREGEAAG